MATTLVNGPGYTGVLLSVIKFDYLSTNLLCLPQQVHYNFDYIQLLLQANPTRLLEVQLFSDLFSYWCHLLQELHVLLISTIGGYPPATTSTGALGKYDFMYAKT
jgi:hypothetical protein